MNPRIFAGVYLAGIVYADRHCEVAGDYARLAFLPFATLEPSIEASCPKGLRVEIEAHMASIQARRGQPFQISTAGQTVILGTLDQAA